MLAHSWSASMFSSSPFLLSNSIPQGISHFYFLISPLFV